MPSSVTSIRTNTTPVPHIVLPTERTTSRSSSVAGGTPETSFPESPRRRAASGRSNVDRILKSFQEAGGTGSTERQRHSLGDTTDTAGAPKWARKQHRDEDRRSVQSAGSRRHGSRPVVEGGQSATRQIRPQQFHMQPAAAYQPQLHHQYDHRPQYNHRNMPYQHGQYMNSQRTSKSFRQELQQYRTPIKAIWYGVDALSYTGIAVGTAAATIATSVALFPVGPFIAPFVAAGGVGAGVLYYAVSKGLRRLVLGRSRS